MDVIKDHKDAFCSCGISSLANIEIRMCLSFRNVGFTCFLFYFLSMTLQNLGQQVNFHACHLKIVCVKCLVSVYFLAFYSG